MASYRIDAFGAVADTTTPNTAAIQKAIDQCHADGGGQVICGPGTYLTGALELKSHVELHLEAGCRLLGSPALEDYSPLIAAGFNHELAPEKSSQSLIRAVGAEAIAITGPGTIDGGGLAFYDSQPEGKLAKPETPRPRLVMFYRCRDIRLQDTRYVDSACWTLWLMQSEDIQIQRLHISGNRRLRNVDGIDIDGCRNVTVSDCLMETEDDCLVLRAIQHLYETPAVCENITVSNCVLKSNCQGIRVGCPSDGVIRRASFTNLIIESENNGIVFDNPARYLNPNPKASRADISRILFSHMAITCRRTPIKLSIGDGIALTRLEDIRFTDMQIESGDPCTVQGSPQTTIHNISFSNMQIRTTGDDAIVCRRCSSVRLSEVELSHCPDTKTTPQ